MLVVQGLSTPVAAAWQVTGADRPPGGGAPGYPLVDSLGRVARLISRLKTEFTARDAGSPVEFGATSLLIALVEGGPKRAGALAEAVFMDPSQVSRQVQVLVRAGLVERRVDSGDGRAILLAATPQGEAFCSTLMGDRADYLRRVVADWPARDVENFAGYLDRFASALEQTGSRAKSRVGRPPGWDPRPGDD